MIHTLRRIAAALEEIAAVLRSGTIQVKDVDRAKVYSEHLGQKLNPQRAGTSDRRETEERS